MTATDLQTMLLGQMFDVLTVDSTLVATFGAWDGTTNPWLYPVWAKPDAPMPYICHRFELRANDGEWVTRTGTYLVDIFSSSNKADEALAIRDRCMTLLDQQSWDISSGGTEYVTALRLSLQTDGFVPEDTEDTWHYVLQFNCRLVRRGEINSILTRS
ncbi:MAG: hypothetical protein BWY79_01231 [Actinobacteria bacterium ADurb.Bin444]|nr:MAG: hypothetical protein BWY79_01231 [Actinobacteria bacterium ADurb.Bin444]